jgi:IPT/TIG domain-containing protein
MKSVKYFFNIAAALLLSATIFTSCTKEAKDPAKASENPQPNAIDPGRGPGGEVLTLRGSGLGDIVDVVFEKGNVPASFNPVFNTESAFVFRVPDTANGGTQNIIFKNRLGKEFTVAFDVIALPSISEVSNYNFTDGTVITLTGNNLLDVTSVVLTGDGTPVTIISQTKKELVIEMPASTLNRSFLTITNATGPITTTQEFVNLDLAFKFFTDNYAPGYQDASWGDGGFISTTEFKSGTASVGKKYAAGNWHQLGIGWTNTPNNNYTYLSFWIKGASKNYSLWISTQTSVGGFASFEPSTKIDVPANVWTYFKIPVNTLNLWATGTAFNQIGWRIQGPDGQDETFYLDDVILVK